MDSDNQEIIYCADDDENRVYCEVCDKLSIERFYKNHLKSLTHTNNKHKRENQFKEIHNHPLIKKHSRIQFNI